MSTSTTRRPLCQHLVHSLQWLGRPFFWLLFLAIQLLLASRRIFWQRRMPIFLGGFLALGYFAIFYRLPRVTDLADHNPRLTTKILDRQGRLLYKFYRREDRTLIHLSDLPRYVLDATLAAEDKEFWHHPGVSPTGVLRAIFFDLRHPHQPPIGGSTITQQLVKNVFLGSEKTIRRKLREIVLALLVERKFSKEQILEMYLNTIPYGGTTYGIEEASQRYFGHPARQLSLAEAAFLAGLPKAPSRYSPFGAHPELAKQRQRAVLAEMLRAGFISPQDYQQALAEPLHFQSQAIKILAPHFVFYVKDILSQRYGERLVEEGGLTVTTSLDLDLQQKGEKILREELDRVAAFHVGNGAALVLQPKTGEILAMIGSKDYFDFAHDGNVNVTLQERQPGSAIKPVNYAVALSMGFTPATIISDTPISFQIPGQPAYQPHNYDHRFHGPVSLRTALGSSLNVPAVKVLASYGVPRMITMGRQLGITSWTDPQRYGLSLTLGGGEVRMIDLATVYATLANLGQRVDPNPLLIIRDARGHLIYQRPPLKPKPVLDPGVAFLLNDILSDDQARSLAFGRHSLLEIPGARVAVKTGTTNDLRDNWAVGYTPYFVVATWVGNNDNSPMSHVASGITGATPIWRRLTLTLLQQYPQTGWPVPDDIVRRQICLTTGTLPCPGCPQVGWEYFLRRYQPGGNCRQTTTNKQLTTNNGK